MEIIYKKKIWFNSKWITWRREELCKLIINNYFEQNILTEEEKTKLSLKYQVLTKENLYSLKLNYQMKLLKIWNLI